MRATTTLMIASVALAACSLTGADPDTRPVPDSASTTVGGGGQTTTTVESSTTGSTIDRSGVTVAAEPDLVLPEVAVAPYLPIAVGDETLVTYSDGELVTHTIAGSTAVDIAEIAPGIGDFFDVSTVVWWRGRFWAFLVGDVSTGLGVGSALTSGDGLEWNRVEIGSTAGGARVPGGFATPDVPQYEGTTGVQHAAADADTLVASGWTRTDAGVQPVVWTTHDGTTWSTDAPPAASERAMGVRVAPGDDEVLVHVLGPFYFGQELALITASDVLDASLVGDQYVVDIVRSGGGYLMSSSGFGGPPTALWEWDGRGWTNIAEPEILPMADDGSEIRPYLLAGSEAGGLAAGLDTVSLRHDGSWREIGSVQGSIVSVSVDGNQVVVVSTGDDGALVTRLPLGR